MNATVHATHDETARPPVPLATVQKAAHIIDSSGLPDMLEQWRAADEKYRGGRPAHISMRAVLIAWLILAMETQPMHVKLVSVLLHTRLTADAAAVLGITLNPFVQPETLAERTRTATTRIFNLIDAEPVSNRHRRQTKAERQADLNWRAKNVNLLEERKKRRDIFHNALLEATYQLLPARYRPDRVSVTVDATRLKLYSRGVGKKRLLTMPDDGRISSEPDAGFYRRDKKGNIPDENSTKTPRILEYALEAEFAVLTSNDPSRPDAVPNIVLAYGMHIPGQQPVLAARRMVDSIWSRGHEIDHFAGDRAYLPAGDPDILQNPLRLRGVKLLMDYPIDQLGIRGHKHGAILVEGTWYSPGMPKSLIDATLTYRNALKAADNNSDLTPAARRERNATLEAEWRKKLALRTQYRLREKERPDSSGRVPMMCPAAGKNPTMTCPLKELIKDSRVNAPALMPIINVPKAPGAICRNKTSTSFNLTDGGSHGQYYEFGSKEWEAHYHHGRNNVESFNAYVKDTGTFALGEPGRRRMRGHTAQSVLALITVAAANIRKIREFLAAREMEELDQEETGTVPVAKTRRSRKATVTQQLDFRRKKNQRMNRAQAHRHLLT